jgi:transposase
MPKNGPYDPEFKDNAVALSHLPGKTIVGVARDLGVSAETLRFSVPTDDKQPGIPPEVAAELRELRKRVRELEQDNEILGKAMGWFANRNRGDSR